MGFNSAFKGLIPQNVPVDGTDVVSGGKVGNVQVISYSFLRHSAFL